ncbi:MAG TPA: ABC-type transport auxiliary lipoprotein family protein [Candidatus Hydrogenedens sp.]|nr:ABC-type transport auxiliary lipoprotein family protein [Candidatus Hydrogenedens sp.]
MVNIPYLNIKFVKKTIKKLGMICILVLLSGCISAPSFNYYTLDNSFKPQINEKPICLQVSSIRLAEPLKRKEIMVRKNSVQVEYYSVHLWASSLEELLTNKLNQSFLCQQSEKTTPDYYLHIDVLNFEEVEMPAMPYTDVKFVVQFLDPTSMKVISQKMYTTEKECTSKEVTELVKTFSLSVDEIIEKIYNDAKNINKI